MRSYVGLDIGTTKVAVVVAEPDERGALKVVGVGYAPSNGIRRGVVVDLENTVQSIRIAVAEAERMAGIPIRSVVTGIAGEHVRSINSRGVIAVSRGGARSAPTTSPGWSRRRARWRSPETAKSSTSFPRSTWWTTRPASATRSA